jgi:GT2 family glycosyltransferase
METIVQRVRAPKVDADGPLQALVHSTEHDEYVGRLAIIRINRGKIAVNQTVALIGEKSTSNVRVSAIFSFEGTKRVKVESAEAGDIVALSGMEDVQIGDTIAAMDKQEALPRITVEEPTIKVTFMVNTSPFAGKSGKWVTSRHVRERLYKEAMKNLALRVEDTAEPDTFLVFGRGELMLAILAETMRREGYEFSLGMPEVVVKDIDGVKSEPVELVIIDVPDQYVGAVTTRLGERRGQMMKMANLGFGRANNAGYRATTGECVLFLNPDTISNAAALEHCVSRALAEADLGLISPRLQQADGTMDLACRRSIPTLWDGFCRATGLAARFPRTALFAGYNLTHLPVDGTYDVGAINGAFMLGRRELFEKTGQFDEAFFMYGDDLDLCIRVARAGYRIVYDGGVAITHLKGLSVAKDFDRMSAAIFDANRDVYLKHFGRAALSRLKWRLMFGLWKRVALLRAKRRGHRAVRPV